MAQYILFLYEFAPREICAFLRSLEVCNSQAS